MRPLNTRLWSGNRLPGIIPKCLIVAAVCLGLLIALMTSFATGQEIIKWEQSPDTELSGLHAHDYDLPPYDAITLADDWQCQGGEVTDIHWWGNYEEVGGVEQRGSSIAYFHLSIHANDPQNCLPVDPEVWGVDVPFTSVNETNSGSENSEACTIYKYDYYLTEPFAQVEGEYYWLDICAYSNDPVDPAIWRWQESYRGPSPSLCPAAEKTTTIPWHSIMWEAPDPDEYSDMAFRIDSEENLPDLIISQKYEIWVVQDSLYDIYYCVQNIGSGTAAASFTRIWIDGAVATTRTCPQLGPGESFCEQVGQFVFSSPTDTIQVCADYNGSITEPDETNNCLDNIWGSLPDLQVTDKYETGITHDTYDITYTVTNTGTASANASTTCIYLDSVLVGTRSCPALTSGQTFSETVGPYTISDRCDTIEICADNDDVVTEFNETNNCLQNEYSSYIDEDVNDDGSVDVLDLVSVAMHLMETGSPGWIVQDVKKDGSIDVLDLVSVANELLNSWPWS